MIHISFFKNYNNNKKKTHLYEQKTFAFKSENNITVKSMYYKIYLMRAITFYIKQDRRSRQRKEQNGNKDID